MKKLITIILVALTTSINAQEQCGTDALMMGMPRNQRMMPPPEVDLDTAEVITIPLVFHIVHLGEPVGEGTNISDEQIQSAVDALNEDFRKIEGTNGDGLGVDTKIEFCLASRSPDNLPTTGILRHDGSDLIYSDTFAGQSIYEVYATTGVTSMSGFSNPNGVPATYMKDVYGCWDLDDYLNIWVVSEIEGNNGGNGIQGFSYIGFNDTQCHGGPVILYNRVGTVGNIKSGNLNKTLTHELGHNFLLYHTFGFGGSSCTETNCETQGDQVCDTPPTTPNYGCSPTECDDAQVNNYMDYTSQTCRNTFTQGQTERMRNEIWVRKNGYTQSLGCIPVTDVDGGISNIAVLNPNCNTTFDVTITLANFGIEELTNPTITLTNGTSQQTSDIELSLLGGETFTTTVEFTSLFSSTIEADVVFEQSEDFITNNTNSTEFIYEDGNTLKIELSPDVWSNELDWELLDEDGEIVVGGGGYPVFSQDSTFVDEVCLFGSCYTFNLYDSNGDGMCSIDLDGDGNCDIFYDAFLRITLNDEVIFELTDVDEMDFGSQLTFEFCDEVVDCVGDVNGDNRVSVTDVMTMLSQIGCVQIQNPCPADLNGDGVVNSDDLFIVLSNYGNACSAVVLIEEFTEMNVMKVYTELPLGFYDLSGRWVSSDEGTLRSGIYILIEERDGSVVQSKIFIQ